MPDRFAVAIVSASFTVELGKRSGQHRPEPSWIPVNRYNRCRISARLGGSHQRGQDFGPEKRWVIAKLANALKQNRSLIKGGI